MAPPPKLTVSEWAERYRWLSAETSARPGKYSLAITPYLRGPLDAFTDRKIRKIVCQKSAQVGWTDGVINNVLGYIMHVAPAPVGIMFPRDQNAKDYNVEKFGPMVDATPVLAEIVNVKTRSLENTQNRKKFPGGFLKLFGSNSTGGVKSTPLKIVVVEEPDDCNQNIKGQGDSIKLAEERLKSYDQSKVLAGGTPSIKGISAIESEMDLSDKRYFMVPCHDCGDAHALSWENVHWGSDETRSHMIYGTASPETAFYSCPHCGSVWNDAAKNRNVRLAAAQQAEGVPGVGWVATAEFRGVAGFYLNELYSAFGESRLARLVEKYLASVHKANEGEVGDLIAFWNSSLGLAYEYQSNAPDAESLADRAKDYEEFTVPWGGLLLTAGVDVQHDRVAVVIRAWGRGEENWLVYWGEIPGVTVVPNQGAWIDLDALLTKEFEHASGVKLRIRAVSIDSSDGTTQDAVYAFVRSHPGRGYMAIKGGSEASSDRREIFTKPNLSIDIDRKQKAFKYGLRPFIVGTARAKDLLIEGRLPLTGSGPGRMHWYKKVRPDYWEQLVSEIKAPHRTQKNRKVWTKKSGVRNEALDCEVYAFHAARSLKTNLLKEASWSMLENAIRQRTLLGAEESESIDDVVVVRAAAPSADESAGLPEPEIKVSGNGDSANKSPAPPARRPQYRPPVRVSIKDR